MQKNIMVFEHSSPKNIAYHQFLKKIRGTTSRLTTDFLAISILFYVGSLVVCSRVSFVLINRVIGVIRTLAKQVMSPVS